MLASNGSDNHSHWPRRVRSTPALYRIYCVTRSDVQTAWEGDRSFTMGEFSLRCVVCAAAACSSFLYCHILYTYCWFIDCDIHIPFCLLAALFLCCVMFFPKFLLLHLSSWAFLVLFLVYCHWSLSLCVSDWERQRITGYTVCARQRNYEGPLYVWRSFSIERGVSSISSFIVPSCF